MKSKFKDKTGSSSVLVVGLIFALISIAFLIMELGSIYNNYYTVNSLLQRACNNAVEYAMDENYRSDYVSKIDGTTMILAIEENLNTTMPDTWDWEIDRIYSVLSPPYVNVTGTITLPTTFSQYGFDDITLNFDIIVKNIRLD